MPGAHLVFLGDGEPGFVEALARLARATGVADRVHFLPERARSTSCSRTPREADVGVSLLEPTCENHRLALPNKLFEYIAAGVPVVASRAAGGSSGWSTSTASAGPPTRRTREAVARRAARPRCDGRAATRRSPRGCEPLRTS